MRSPTLSDLEEARETFALKEPRDLFYRAATELVGLAWEGGGTLSLPEAIAVLLQTWNVSFYRFRGGFSSADFEGLDKLLSDVRENMSGYRARTIVSMDLHDESDIVELFGRAELQLGPVGAAKTLHLLAPKFFPIWDRAIARAYRCGLGRVGTNGVRYLRFMKTTRTQVAEIQRAGFTERNPLKAIDEYNYCRFTNKWLVA